MKLHESKKANAPSCGKLAIRRRDLSNIIGIVYSQQAFQIFLSRQTPTYPLPRACDAAE
jgi:hypothetical protein